MLEALEILEIVRRGNFVPLLFLYLVTLVVAQLLQLLPRDMQLFQVEAAPDFDTQSKPKDGSNRKREAR